MSGNMSRRRNALKAGLNSDTDTTSDTDTDTDTDADTDTDKPYPNHDVTPDDVVDELQTALFVYSDDNYRNYIDVTNTVEYIIEADVCLTTMQVKWIREDDRFTLRSVHPNDDGVAVHLSANPSEF